jgi:hypothetical protein
MSEVSQETPTRVEESPTRAQPGSLFLAVYEFEEGRRDPQTEEYVSFLNELYDEPFNIDRTFEIEFLDPSVHALAFTFG